MWADKIKAFFRPKRKTKGKPPSPGDQIAEAVSKKKPSEPENAESIEKKQ